MAAILSRTQYVDNLRPDRNSDDKLANEILLRDYWIFIPPLNEVEGCYTGFTLSVCPSVRLQTESCPLCILYNTRRIHLMITHLSSNFTSCTFYYQN